MPYEPGNPTAHTRPPLPPLALLRRAINWAVVMSVLVAIGGIVGAIGAATSTGVIGVGIAVGVTVLAFASMLMLAARWAAAWADTRG